MKLMKRIRKMLRSALYILLMLALALLPDAYLWLRYVCEWPWWAGVAWWVPTLLLLLAEVGLQAGFFHKASVRVLFTMLLFSVLPKILFVVFGLVLPWWLALLPSLGVMGWFLYGFVEGWRRLEVRYVTYRSPDLPPYFDGYKLLHLSDLHLGTFPEGSDFVRQVVERANQEDVDMMLFTGDLVNNSASEVVPYIDTLSQLHAPDGVFSIWGNHDYCEYDNNHSISALRRNRRQLFGYQERMGWRQLMNEHCEVSHGMASIYIIGVENAGQPPFANRSNLRKAMKGVPKDSFKILLTHDPHHWRREALGRGIQLTLSGHTHAGQIKVCGVTPARMAFKEWGGAYRRGLQMMYVSPGLGGSLPFRIGAWPEMTVITLRRDNKKGDKDGNKGNKGNKENKGDKIK